MRGRFFAVRGAVEAFRERDGAAGKFHGDDHESEHFVLQVKGHGERGHGDSDSRDGRPQRVPDAEREPRVVRDGVPAVLPDRLELMRE